MSLAGFLEDGDLTRLLGDVLKRTLEPVEYKGRPFIVKKEPNIRTFELFDNSIKTKLDFLDKCRDLQFMLASYAKVKDKFNGPVYVFWEVWLDRKVDDRDLDQDEMYTEKEKGMIMQGSSKVDTGPRCNVVRFIRELNFEGYPATDNYTIIHTCNGIVYKTELPFPLHSYKFKDTFDTKKFFKELNASNVGIECGGPIQFPSWMDKVKLTSFIKKYNEAAMIVINTPRTTLKARKENYDDMFEGWIDTWTECLKGRRSLEEWSEKLSFSIELLIDHDMSVMSMFGWWGRQARIVFQAGAEESELLVTTDGLLEPRKMVVSEKAIVSSFKFPPKYDLTPFKVAILDQLKISNKLTEKNPYVLLSTASGGQNVEHVSLSSVLGSGSHITAALLGLHDHPDMPTSIMNERKLEEYANELPKVVKEAGKALMLSPVVKDGNTPLKAFLAAEFPVYLIQENIEVKKKHKFFYSRIDGLTREFEDNEGLCVWEFKTKWGRDTAYEKDALLPDIRQAAFYCYCLEQMLPVDVKVEFFYIRYAQVHENTINVFTYKYRYRLANDTLIFNFATLLRKRKKITGE
jgi:hypothetical protein